MILKSILNRFCNNHSIQVHNGRQLPKWHNIVHSNSMHHSTQSIIFVCSSNIFNRYFLPQLSFWYSYLVCLMGCRFGADPMRVGFAGRRIHWPWERIWGTIGSSPPHFLILPLRGFSEREVGLHYWCILLCSRSGKLYLFFLHGMLEDLIIYSLSNGKKASTYKGEFIFLSKKESSFVQSKNKWDCLDV